MVAPSARSSRARRTSSRMLGSPSVLIVSSTACILARLVLSCPVAVCVPVYERRESVDLDTFQVSRDALHVHLIALCGTRDLSCCFLHAVHDVRHAPGKMHNSFRTGVLCTARFTFSSSTSDFVVGVLFTLGVDTGLEPSRPSTTITSRVYFGITSPSIQEPFSQSLFRERSFCRPVAPFVPQFAS